MKWDLKWFITTIVAALAMLGLGQCLSNWWLSPKLYAVGGHFSLTQNAKYQSSLYQFVQRLMTEDQSRTIEARLRSRLKRYGLAPEKIDAFLAKSRTGSRSADGSFLESGQFTTNEKTVIALALSAVTQDFLTESADAIRRDFLNPNHVLYFRVINMGRIDARNVHIQITFPGVLVAPDIKAENMIKSQSAGAGGYVVILDKLSPHASVTGSIWFATDETSDPVVMADCDGDAERIVLGKSSIPN